MNRVAAFTTVLLVTIQPALAFAQATAPEAALEDSVHEAVATEVHQNHSASGLPQFNPETWPSQVFWLAISFVLLYVVFSRFILPSLGATIQMRSDKIEGDIRTADVLSHQAETIKADYESRLKAAAAEASSRLKHSEEEAKTRSADSLAEFHKRSLAELAAVETRLSASGGTVRREMEAAISEIPMMAADKLAGVRADRAQADEIVNSLRDRAA